MEIYTGDLIDIAQQYADKINKEIKYVGHVVEDECCNLQSDVRKILYKRLSEAFNDLEIDDELRSKLFKIINEL